MLIKFKKSFLPFLFCLFIFFLLLFSSSNIVASKNALFLWANSVLPSLLPFFISTELLSYTNIVYYFGLIFKKIMNPLFNVSGNGVFPFIMGIISGYPVGIKITANLKEKGLLSNVECERLIAFTNNSSLLFILGTVGVSLFNNKKIGILLLCIHIFSSFTVGFIFKFWKKNSSEINTHLNFNTSSNYIATFSSLGEILANSISSAINTCLIVGGFIVLFSVVISMLKNFISFDNPTLNGVFFGLIELTNGLNDISSLPLSSTNIIACSLLIGFGGISIMLQVFSIASQAKISIKPYIIGKILHGTLSAFYTFLYLWFTGQINT